MNEGDLVKVCMWWFVHTFAHTSEVSQVEGYKVHGNGVQRSGEPDLDLSVRWADGSVSFYKLEAKIGLNTTSAIQDHRLERYKLIGYTTGVFYTIEQFKELIIHGQRYKVA